MKRTSLIRILSAVFLSGSAFAGTMGPVIQEPDWPWVSTLSLGPVWGEVSKTQTFFLAPGIEKTYVADKSNNSLFDGEIFLGLQKVLSPRVQGQLGLEVAATSDAKLSGVIWDDTNPIFNNHIYSYKVSHAHVALKGKLLADGAYWLIPWIDGSLGVGFNTAHSFVNTPVIFEALPNPNFRSHTQTAFTYTVGAGVQKALTPHWQVGIGYEFADWGESQLGRAAEQTQNSGLSLNHVYTNGVLFNLTYLA